MPESLRVRLILCFAAAILVNSAAFCSDPASRWIDPDGVKGKLLICGGGKLPQSIFDKFVESAGGETARLVIIPTATFQVDEAAKQDILEFWGDKEVESVTVLHTRSRDEANSAAFTQPLTEATGVWFGGGQQSRIAEAYVGTAVEVELQAMLNRGGIVAGTSAGAAIQSKLMIASGNPVAVIKTGLDLLPDSVIDQHFSQRKRMQRLTGVMESHPGFIGFGIDEATALFVDGRDLEVIGKHTVTVRLSASKTREALAYELKQGDYADLTALRRAARDRAAPAFPPAEVNAPRVPSGALVLGGGGKLPDEVVAKFIELAGGNESLIVVFPTASSDLVPKNSSSERMLRKAGALNVVSLPQRKRSEVENDDFLNTLKQASGVWFGGGRQWRFVDAYENTRAYDAIHDVLRRGGVVGGSSAGASIQGEYLCRGSPLGNEEIMAEGYERGFNFLPSTAIDQHFSQRKRSPDMERLIKLRPQLLGIGIDESTALVVQGETATVLGTGKATLFHSELVDGKPDLRHLDLSGGEQISLPSVVSAN